MPRRDDMEEIRSAVTAIRQDVAGTKSGVEGKLADFQSDNAGLRREVLAAVQNGLGERRDEFRELRSLVLEMRSEVMAVRQEAQQARTEVESLRREAAEARAQASEEAERRREEEQARQEHESIARTAAFAAMSSGEAGGDGGYEELLDLAAGVAFARMVCHRDTWAFLVERTINAEHFRIPADIEEQPDGTILVELSGRSLIACVDVLWGIQGESDVPAGTRRLAAKIYSRIGQALKKVKELPEGGVRTEANEKLPAAQIVIDDRPDSPEAAPSE